MNLKIGGSNVGKIMYNGQEFGGATKLEPGTLLYTAAVSGQPGLENVHLSNTTKNWSNLNGINVKMYDKTHDPLFVDINITGDDFKNLDKVKTYEIKRFTMTVTVSRSIVDGEYKLNISTDNFTYIFEIKAI